VKVLLIDPPFKKFTGFVSFYYPIGLAYLAAVLRNESHEVSVFEVDAIRKSSDLDFSDEYRRRELYRQGLNDDTHEALVLVGPTRVAAYAKQVDSEIEKEGLSQYVLRLGELP